MLYVAILTGLMGSLHCAGMCGPIALALPYRGGVLFFYHFGRVLTYGLIGALFGYAGEGLIFVGMQQWVTILAGVMMLAFFWLPNLNGGVASLWTQKLTGLFGSFFARRDASGALMVGVLNGMLPCGLVYTAALGAVSLAHIWEGALFMVFFGLGTLPMMAAFSFKRKWVTPQMRQYFRKAMPVFVTCLGILLIMRGLGLGIPILSPAFAQTGASCH